MLTQLFNHRLNCYHTTVTRDTVGSITYAPVKPPFATNIPGRIDVASSLQKYEHSQRNIEIDFVGYLQTEVINGDQIENITKSPGKFLRVISVKPYFAQGNIPDYFEVGLLKIER